MQAQMANIFKFFSESPVPIWLMAQIKGINSHALLLVKMVQVEDGYEMEVVDSNHPLVIGRILYQVGDERLQEEGEKYNFVPYVGFQNDFKAISQSLKEYCGNKEVGMASKLAEVFEGQVELP